MAYDEEDTDTGKFQIVIISENWRLKNSESSGLSTWIITHKDWAQNAELRQAIHY